MGDQPTMTKSVASNLANTEKELDSIRQRLIEISSNVPDEDVNTKNCIGNAIAEIESAIGELEEARSSTSVSPRSRP